MRRRASGRGVSMVKCRGARKLAARPRKSMLRSVAGHAVDVILVWHHVRGRYLVAPDAGGTVVSLLRTRTGRAEPEHLELLAYDRSAQGKQHAQLPRPSGKP